MAAAGQYASRLTFDYTGDFWGWLVEGEAIGEGMQPATGFVLRPGTIRSFGTLRERPRPGGPFRTITFRENATLVTDPDGDVLDRALEFSIGPAFESGDDIQLEIERRSEKLLEPSQHLPSHVQCSRSERTQQPGEPIDATYKNDRRRPPRLCICNGRSRSNYRLKRTHKDRRVQKDGRSLR